MRVASEVRALRGRYSITQERLAEVLGTTQSQVSKRLRGEIPFTLDDLDRLAVFFNVKPTQLLDGAPGNGQGPDGGGIPTVPLVDLPASDLFSPFETMLAAA